MKKESLILFRDCVIKLLSMYDKEEIVDILERMEKMDAMDRGELMINMYHFLTPSNYDSSIETLRKENNKWKRM